MQEETFIQRRNVLTATGTVALLGVAGVASGRTASTVANAPVPNSPDSHTYPTMGSGDGTPTATVYGNFKCPYTKEFVSGNLQAIIDEFVTTGRLALRFYNLAYQPGDTSAHYISSSDPRCAAMGIGVWNEDPDSYWQFFAETFDDPPEGYVDYSELASRARSAGVSNADTIAKKARAGEYDAAVERISDEAGANGVTFTPTLELAGDTTAPHHGTQAILDWIESRLGDASANTGNAGSERTENRSADESGQQSEDATAPEERASETSTDSSNTTNTSGSTGESSETDEGVIDTEMKNADSGDNGNAIWSGNERCNDPWQSTGLLESDDEC